MERWALEGKQCLLMQLEQSTSFTNPRHTATLHIKSQLQVHFAQAHPHPDHRRCTTACSDP